MDEDFYKRFPCTLCSALIEGIVKFNPDDLSIKDKYDDFTAFRVIHRQPEDDTPINQKDFHSQAEQIEYGTYRGPKTMNINDIGTYSCSVFTDAKDLVNIMHLPRKTKKMIQGLISDTDGLIQASGTDSHVHVWIYSGIDLSSKFEVI